MIKNESKIKIKVINPEENQTEIVHICISNSQI